MVFKKPSGGTEILYDELMKRLPKDIKNKYQIAVRAVDREDREGVLWQHLNHDQPAVSWLDNKSRFEDWDRYAYVSHWQYDRFRIAFDVPENNARVIKNAINPIPLVEKPKEPRLIYVSTPNRGLQLLIEAVKELPVTLDVYSSWSIYGPAEEYKKADESFESVYQECRDADNINYHGSVPHDQLIKALQSSNILAYPSTFEETSCISAMEAFSAGLRVVTTGLGALPETCGEYGDLCTYSSDHWEHIHRFRDVLMRVVDSLNTKESQERILDAKNHFDTYYSWDYRIKEWIDWLG